MTEPSNAESPDELEAKPPAPPAPSEAKRPEWTYLATPLAVFLGALVIAASIWWTNRSDAPAATVLQVTPSTPVASAQAETSGAPLSSANTQPLTLEAAFRGYTKQLALDDTKFFECLAKPETVSLLNTQLERGFKLEVKGTPTFFVNNKVIVGAQPFAIFDEVINAELKGSPTTVDGYSDAVKAIAAKGQFRIIEGKPDVSGATIEGNRNARVMIAEFSDFQCPFCKRWSDDSMARIRAKLGNDVALAFVHFPITQIHPNAGNASAAAICAGEQGKFWQMHDLLFSRQTEWGPLK